MATVLNTFVAAPRSAFAGRRVSARASNGTMRTSAKLSWCPGGEGKLNPSYLDGSLAGDYGARRGTEEAGCRSLELSLLLTARLARCLTPRRACSPGFDPLELGAVPANLVRCVLNAGRRYTLALSPPWTAPREPLRSHARMPCAQRISHALWEPRSTPHGPDGPTLRNGAGPSPCLLLHHC